MKLAEGGSLYKYIQKKKTYSEEELRIVLA